MSTLEVKAIQAPTGFDLQMPAGHILQTIQAESTTQVTLTATSWTDISLSASITPISTSSKILVHVDNSLYNSTSSKHTTLTVFRGSVASGTNLGKSDWGFGSIYDGNNDQMMNLSYTHLDSPSTTSAITYTCAARVNGGTGYAFMNTNKGNITLMEVAG